MTDASDDPIDIAGPAGADPATAMPSAPARASMVPPWLRGATNLFAMLVTAVLVGAALFLLGWLSPVVGPLGLGLFLAALATPLSRWLQARGLSVAIALVVTIGLVVVIGAGIVILAVGSSRTLVESLGAYAADLNAQYAEAAGAGPAAALRDVLPPETLVEILRWVADILVQVGGSLAFAIVIAALLLLDAPRLSRLTASGLGSGNPLLREAPAIAAAAVTYIAVRVRINALTALGLLVLMLVVGVDEALTWAVCSFFLSFVPYLGLTLALIPPTILALAESGPLPALAIVLGGVALNLVAENVLEPTMTGRALSLTTWLVFTMFFFWVWLLGPIGALLSMPITVLLVLLLEHNERTQWLAALLTRRPM